MRIGPLKNVACGAHWRLRAGRTCERRCRDERREIRMNILEYCGRLYENTEIFECRHGAQLLLICDAQNRDFHDLKNLLEEQRYRCYVTNQEGDVLFATYTKENEILNLSFTPFERTIRVIRDMDCALPPCAESAAAEPQNGKAAAWDLGTGAQSLLAAPLVTQLHQRYWQYDCGMTYLIRLGDGRFAVIDGGMAEEGEVEHLLELLKEQNVTEGLPQIAVWFFTHAHIDHFNGFVKMMREYREQVQVECLAYSWVRQDLAKGFSPLEGFEAAIDEVLAWENPPKIIRPRSGQRFVYPGVTFDVMYTCEDLYPNLIPNLNDSSLVMRMTACGRRVYWLADMQARAAGYLAKKYPKDSFSCEILQVAHHGYWGASEELYELMDPEVLFWPCPGFRYPELLEWDGNHFLRDSKKIRRIYVSGLEETTLDMTEPLPQAPAYEAKDGLIYEEDFQNCDAFKLYWGCIRGRSQVYYKSYGLSFPEEGGCRLSAGEDWCVCEWANASRMDAHPSYRLTFSGRAEAGCEKMGLFWNDPTPRVWDEEKVLWIPVKEGAFYVELTADAESQTARLCCSEQPMRENGQLMRENGQPAWESEPPVWEGAYMPAERRSICLVMRNGAAVFEKIRIEALK